MSPDPVRVLAVDLGASSVRVAAVDLAARSPSVEILHRWPHGPVRHRDGSLRWDWDRIVAEIERGLVLGITAGPVASIGVDGWAVDYGLIDAAGRLLSPPFSYRDDRTAEWHTVLDTVGADRLYAVTGVQLMAINTIFQIAAHDPAELGAAHRLLLLPDLLVRSLTRFEGAERSNASTTALMDAATGEWSKELATAISLDPGLLPPVVPAGRRVGEWRGVPVHTVGSHDTASAFVAMPGVPGPGTALVSSGTWVLVGAERVAVDTSSTARLANFSNESGALGGVRFLKNVMGLWMLERCRPRWGDPPMAVLVEEAAAVDGPVPLVDATDDRFLSPADMDTEIRNAAGLAPAEERGVVVRSILESIAAGVASVVAELGTVGGTPIDELFVVGGGARIELLNRLFAKRTGLPVTVGSEEASALGNAIVQGVALGRFRHLDEARAWAAIGAKSV